MLNDYLPTDSICADIGYDRTSILQRRNNPPPGTDPGCRYGDIASLGKTKRNRRQEKSPQGGFARGSQAVRESVKKAKLPPIK